MEILVNQTIGSKTQEVFQLRDSGSIMVMNDRDTLLDVRAQLQRAIVVIDHWLLSKDLVL